MVAQKSKAKTFETMVKGAALDARRPSLVHARAGYLQGDAVKKIEDHLKSQGRTIQEIPLRLIDLGDNVRRSYDPEALKVLATSLQSDGLIQYPTLALKKGDSGFKLVCRNGHRRIMAAASLGWEKIDCVILPFDSVKEELYHSINANLRENVFYLDIAEAYERAAAIGESDTEIGKRVGVNHRTVRWYRRLMEMSPACQALVRANPELFNATWAIKLARLGALPEAAVLETNMKQMLKEGKTFLKDSERKPTPKHTETEEQLQQKAESSRMLQDMQKRYRKRGGRAEAKRIHELLSELVLCGFLSQKIVTKIEYEVFGEQLTDSFYK